MMSKISDESLITTKEQQTSKTPKNTQPINLRNQKRIDYYEDFSDEDEEEYAEAEEKHSLMTHHPPVRRKRKRPKEKQITVENIENPEKEASPSQNNSSSAYGNIFDITQYKPFISPEENEEMLNSDVILILLELCLNSNSYGINLDNSSRNFWEKLSQQKSLTKLFAHFKAETLRKYWRKLRTTYKYKKLISAIKEHKHKLNHESMKLLSSINAICDFVINDKKGIDYYIKKYAMKTTAMPRRNVIKEKNGNNSEEEDVAVINDNLNPVRALKEILNVFQKTFPKVDKENIYNVLLAVNGNIEEAFLFFKDEKNFGYLPFTNNEDETILNGNDEDILNLSKKRGYDYIRLRKSFLTK